jgi:hypothetical protein
MFWMWFYNVVSLVFVEDSLLIDVAEVSNGIQMSFRCCLLIVLHSSTYLCLTIRIQSIELLFEIQQSLLQKFTHSV